MTSVSRPGSALPGSRAGTEPAKECAAGLHEARQHDEEVAGDEGGDERVARLAEDVPGANRRERRRPVPGAPTG